MRSIEPPKIKIRTRYCLIRWKVWAENIRFLAPLDKETATIFFTALKQLGKEDTAFLADKYLTSNGCLWNERYTGANTYKPRTDEETADRLGLELGTYRRERQRIENKLEDLMNGEKERCKNGNHSKRSKR